MYANQDQLTELVRRLEEKQHIFAADPILITEKLQHESGEPLSKLPMEINSTMVIFFTHNQLGTS